MKIILYFPLEYLVLFLLSFALGNYELLIYDLFSIRIRFAKAIFRICHSIKLEAKAIEVKILV